MCLHFFIDYRLVILHRRRTAMTTRPSTISYLAICPALPNLPLLTTPSLNPAFANPAPPAAWSRPPWPPGFSRFGPLCGQTAGRSRGPIDRLAERSEAGGGQRTCPAALDGSLDPALTTAITLEVGTRVFVTHSAADKSEREVFVYDAHW